MILRKYGEATTILFPLIDFGATDFESTPVSFAAGDIQISKDEGAFANTSNTPSHEGNGIYSLALTAAEMQAARIVITLIDQTATKTWEDQALVIETWGHASAQLALDYDLLSTHVNVLLEGTVDNSAFSPTTTQFEADDITEATDDHFKDRLIVFTSGNLLRQVVEITGYTLEGSNGRFQVSALTEAPANDDTFLII